MALSLTVPLHPLLSRSPHDQVSVFISFTRPVTFDKFDVGDSLSSEVDYKLLFFFKRFYLFI